VRQLILWQATPPGNESLWAWRHKMPGKFYCLINSDMMVSCDTKGGRKVFSADHPTLAEQARSRYIGVPGNARGGGQTVKMRRSGWSNRIDQPGNKVRKVITYGTRNCPCMPHDVERRVPRSWSRGTWPHHLTGDPVWGHRGPSKAANRGFEVRGGWPMAVGTVGAATGSSNSARSFRDQSRAQGLQGLQRR